MLAIADNDTPIICNGFKDDEYIEMVMLAQENRPAIMPVVEKFTELELIAKHAEKVGVKPNIGLRVKLASRGSGRWKSSGGYRSKFGLTVSEALKAVDYLSSAAWKTASSLLHFHLGSQITNIRQIKAAVIEAARMYVDLKRAGTGLTYIDVGGGLGIDYDGSQTDFESSVNYTLRRIRPRCRLSHPEHLRRSGSSAPDHHHRKRPRSRCVSQPLVFNVLGVSGFGEEELPAICPKMPSSP